MNWCWVSLMVAVPIFMTKSAAEAGAAVVKQVSTAATTAKLFAENLAPAENLAKRRPARKSQARIARMTDIVPIPVPDAVTGFWTRLLAGRPARWLPTIKVQGNLPSDVLPRSSGQEAIRYGGVRFCRQPASLKSRHRRHGSGCRSRNRPDNTPFFY